MKKIAVIIVAAGASSRMKRAKQLLPFGETTLLGHAIEQAEASVAEKVYVILGANAGVIKEHFNLPALNVVENKHWEEGIGTSISIGVKEVAEKADFDAILLMLGDQPLIGSVYLDQMITAFRKDPSKIIATKYPKSTGVPAIFPKKYFPKLMLLEGDSGAKSLLYEYGSQVISLAAGKKIKDIDTPEDYKNLLEQLSSWGNFI